MLIALSSFKMYLPQIFYCKSQDFYLQLDHYHWLLHEELKYLDQKSLECEIKDFLIFQLHLYPHIQQFLINYLKNVNLYEFIANFSNLHHQPSEYHLLFYLHHRQQHFFHKALHSFFVLQFFLFLQDPTSSPFQVMLKYSFYSIYFRNQLQLNRKASLYQHQFMLISSWQIHQ